MMIQQQKYEQKCCQAINLIHQMPNIMYSMNEDRIFKKTNLAMRIRGDFINPLSSSELYPWIDECLPLAPARQTLPHEI